MRCVITQSVTIGLSQSVAMHVTFGFVNTTVALLRHSQQTLFPIVEGFFEMIGLYEVLAFMKFCFMKF